MNDNPDPVVPELAKALAKLDTSKPHPARRYNYWLGGKDNFAADRESGEQIAEFFPTIRLAAKENRRFQRRLVRFLAESGVRQFLDIGTGIPGPENTHQVAQAVDPASRVVYVDNDPVVLTHARALLTSSAEGSTAYIEADVRDPATIATDPQLLRTLDLTRPVGLLLIAVLHFVPDDDRPYEAVAELVRALPAGSYLAISHTTQDFLTPEEVERENAAAASGRHGTYRPRTRAELARFFTGLDMVEPGIQPIAQWRGDDEPQPRPTAKDVAVYGGVARIG